MKEISVIEYAYSFNGADFSFGENTIEETLKVAKEENKHKEVFIGKIVPMKPSIDTDSFFEEMREQANDFVEDGGENYLDDVTKEEDLELYEKLMEVFNNWAKKYKHLPPTRIEEIKRYDLATDKEIK